MSTPTTREVANDPLWRAIWTPPGTPFPAWADHATEDEANLHALRTSRELGVEVAVVRVGEGCA